MKRMNFNPGLSHPLLCLFLDGRAAEVIIYKSYLHTLLCFFYKKLYQWSARIIIFVNVIFYVNVMPGFFDGLHKVGKFILAVNKQFHFIVSCEGTTKIFYKHSG